jgi:hypothetical protein
VHLQIYIKLSVIYPLFSDHYSIILDCWNQDMLQRPDFNTLVELLTIMQESFEQIIFPTKDEEPDEDNTLAHHLEEHGYDDLST